MSLRDPFPASTPEPGSLRAVWEDALAPALSDDQKRDVFAAAKACDTAALSKLLGRGAGAKFAKTDGVTPLMAVAQGSAPAQGGAEGRGLSLAAALGTGGPCARRLAAAAFLLERSDPKARDESGDDALMHAIRQGDKALAMFLAPHSDLRARNEQGMDALALAVLCGELETARFLAPFSDLRGQDNEGTTALMHAVGEKDERFWRFLAPLSDLAQTDQFGRSALVHAVLWGSPAAVEALLALPGARPTARDNKGLDALGHAAERGDEKILETMLPLGDPKATDLAGMTPLMRAAKKGSEKCVELLLPVSDPSAVDLAGNDALIWALRSRSCEASIQLLARHCPPLTAAEDGLGAVEIAATKGDLAHLAPLFARATHEQMEQLLLRMTRAMHPALGARTESFFMEQALRAQMSAKPAQAALAPNPHAQKNGSAPGALSAQEKKARKSRSL